MKSLPQPRSKGPLSVEEAIAGRRSVRSYAPQGLTDEELSQLLWAAQGITERRQGLRAAPSAGATYPLETYVVTAEGVFHYEPAGHALRATRAGDVRTKLAAAALGQEFVRRAPVTIVLAAVPERTTRRYGRRGLTYVHMEAGHAAQNMHLQAVALGLGSVPVGAFDDDAVTEVLGLPPAQIPLYLIPVGR
jgi:SagB-type dehydrogenase family enzyme